MRMGWDKGAWELGTSSTSEAAQPPWTARSLLPLSGRQPCCREVPEKLPSTNREVKGQIDRPHGPLLSTAKNAKEREI